MTAIEGTWLQAQDQLGSQSAPRGGVAGGLRARGGFSNAAKEVVRDLRT